MKSSKISHRIVISGGGTGGHIYPAIAIADEIKKRAPKTELLFVGALGKMEMEKVPQAGYPIQGLPIVGIDRGNLLSNFKMPFHLWKSLQLAKKIIKDFKPDAAIGTGGYASGPLLWQANKHKVPFIIQEQNSFPGITNKLLKNKAFAICVAYEGIKDFPKEKTVYTGNPIRSDLFQDLPERSLAIEKFKLNPSQKVILSVGGSQGSRTLNNAWKKGIESLKKSGVQLIWQTGKLEYEYLRREGYDQTEGVHLTEFIYDMKTAYAAADIIVSRAGAMAISELSLVGKPLILVPFPFAAEDHQTKNAQALADKNAAIMISDKQVPEELIKTSLKLIQNQSSQNQLKENLIKLGKPNATKDVVDILCKLLE